ncbi:MAG: threonylcarbamoyl-AMP synthase [Flavobacteriales bacterium]|nr:threonylcarbamoyl-AMP synthase [Flavobacteriales bacterium]NNK81323.1 threonylcarbamoyl-AMP synthase [Flavobacteriales bacterium]
MLIKIHPENPQEKKVSQVIDCLKSGGVIIYPTDTIYAIGCDIKNHKAVERVARIKGVKLEKANFSLVCYDLSHLSTYAKQIDTQTFKLMKRVLPGPYTFILKASKEVPKLFTDRKKTVGIRVPDNDLTRDLVLRLGGPMVSSSVKDDDEVLEYTTDPELIYERYKDHVDLVIDAGFGKNVPSTVLNCTAEEVEIIREGAGAVDF